MRFCPKCEYYEYYEIDATTGMANLLCRNCGFKEPLTPQSKDEALILETNLRSGSSAGGAASGITVNDYTLKDPTLPHMKNLDCSNTVCPSRTDTSTRDVIYIKTDPTNMKFQYICTVCRTQWTN